MDVRSAFQDMDNARMRRLVRHMRAVREHWHTVVWLKQALADDDGLAFLEAWGELDRTTQVALWVAPRYGGVWTTDERTRMRDYWAGMKNE